MVNKLLYVAFLILLLLASVALTRFLLKKVKLNRWIIGGAAPLVLIVPSIIFENMSTLAWNILSAVFAMMCIMFFEITRLMLENNQLKGVVYNRNTKRKNS